MNEQRTLNNLKERIVKLSKELELARNADFFDSTLQLKEDFIVSMLERMNDPIDLFEILNKLKYIQEIRMKQQELKI